MPVQRVSRSVFWHPAHAFVPAESAPGFFGTRESGET
jgi:hypothetical protein